jgi:Bifunctional DNA primase/polymerase, N-terminal
MNAPIYNQWNPENNLLHRAVLQYLTNIWPIIPIWWIEGERCACGQPHCNSPGKHPIAALVPRGIKDATLDQQTAIEWWTRFPKANIGIALGKVSGLVAVDVDGPSGRETLERLLAQFEHTLDPKWFVETGRSDGGRHYYFRYPPNV